MFRFVIPVMALMLCPMIIFAQRDTVSQADTLTTNHELEEVVIISQRTPSAKVSKPLGSLDNYLGSANTVNMIRRGSYAWEPYINGMASERSVITIDGMRIYAACTDKMDPVTSYVDITNLSGANIHSGQSGSTGATIAGSIDLERKKGSFGKKAFDATIFSGFESNNRQKIGGGSLSYAHPKFFTDIDFSYRGAENYKAGGGREVPYSQFTKYNTSLTAGYQINEHEQVETSLIYDHAVNIGYPALTMDVDFAKAIIGSVEYVRHHISPTIKLWETKLYYNNVVHRMDDSKRPDVPIRMDMPGWSKTVGFYSMLQGENEKHRWQTNLSGHRNRSLAEMTMFSNDPAEKDMFMLTWPGVLTNYGDVFMEDEYRISSDWSTDLSAGIAVHNNVVDNQFGLESLKIFYPNMQRSKSRLLKRASVLFKYNKKAWNVAAGLAYGERAPSVSEGYGFYLFNSFDRFDYIGNPEMKNEKSVSGNASLSYNLPDFSVKLSGSWFFIKDYIIGRPRSGLSVMTIGASGVKVYEQLEYAHIFNTSIDLYYAFLQNFSWSGRLGYRRGTAREVNNLPLIQPVTYRSDLGYSLNTFSVDLAVDGAAKQNRVNPEFGERPLPSYAILNLSISNRFAFGQQSMLIKAGVENFLDKNYTTFSDWNRIPRMGRNFYCNVVWNF
ncbi:TonB-dependent receptor [Olivibacter sp. 47]|uniref:TonB-dependent receptor plug domain-containing protein n=1 Tax=Olivibacter sp. 47 TaxID=3056486 RepID=UPI0025A47941|nr:TonB-dependent receptor [Olivibacter sp. 47]MDM8175917.1 TonB-dependent receptor [Olivibacter sp. 47]